MALMMVQSLRPVMRQSLRQTLQLNLQQIQQVNWSLLDAYKEGGDFPLRFEKKKIDVSGMSLEERLAVVDGANKVFHYHYVEATDSTDTVRGYYRVPLRRNYDKEGIDPQDIGERISKAEYLEATAILNGAGRFQRIARAVPYLQLYNDIKEFVENQGYSLDDVIIVGVDRGGRLPSYIVGEALGKKGSYTLKVDQGGGQLDIEKLNDFIKNGVFRDKYVLFVDSTVDSGRQINVLKRYFEDEEWKTRIGHRTWGVVGSNEFGRDLNYHKNLNWGFDPDQAFEDNPELMGVDYVSDFDYTHVIERPTKAYEDIKAALLEVPKGVILDYANLSKILLVKEAYQKIDEALTSRAWQIAQEKDTPDEIKDLGVKGKVSVPLIYSAAHKRKKLLIIGDGEYRTISENDAKYIVDSLVNGFDIIAGTANGNPGFFLDLFSKARAGSAQLYQPKYDSEEITLKEAFGNKVDFHGETKVEFREYLVQNPDAVLAIGGNEGTLTETYLALYAGKPVYIIRKFGAVGEFVNRSRSKFLNDSPNLSIVENLPEAIVGLQDLYNSMIKQPIKKTKAELEELIKDNSFRSTLTQTLTSSLRTNGWDHIDQYVHAANYILNKLSDSGLKRLGLLLEFEADLPIYVSTSSKRNDGKTYDIALTQEQFIRVASWTDPAFAFVDSISYHFSNGIIRYSRINYKGNKIDEETIVKIESQMRPPKKICNEDGLEVTYIRDEKLISNSRAVILGKTSNIGNFHIGFSEEENRYGKSNSDRYGILFLDTMVEESKRQFISLESGEEIRRIYTNNVPRELRSDPKLRKSVVTKIMKEAKDIVADHENLFKSAIDALIVNSGTKDGNKMYVLGGTFEIPYTRGYAEQTEWYFLGHRIVTTQNIEEKINHLKMEGKIKYGQSKVKYAIDGSTITLSLDEVLLLKRDYIDEFGISSNRLLDNGLDSLNGVAIVRLDKSGWHRMGNKIIKGSLKNAGVEGIIIFNKGNYVLFDYNGNNIQLDKKAWTIKAEEGFNKVEIYTSNFDWDRYVHELANNLHTAIRGENQEIRNLIIHPDTKIDERVFIINGYITMKAQGTLGRAVQICHINKEGKKATYLPLHGIHSNRYMTLQFVGTSRIIYDDQKNIVDATDETTPAGFVVTHIYPQYKWADIAILRRADARGYIRSLFYKEFVFDKSIVKEGDYVLAVYKASEHLSDSDYTPQFFHLSQYEDSPKAIQHIRGPYIKSDWSRIDEKHDLPQKLIRDISHIITSAETNNLLGSFKSVRTEIVKAKEFFSQTDQRFLNELDNSYYDMAVGLLSYIVQISRKIPEPTDIDSYLFARDEIDKSYNAIYNLKDLFTIFRGITLTNGGKESFHLSEKDKLYKVNRRDSYYFIYPDKRAEMQGAVPIGDLRLNSIVSRRRASASFTLTYFKPEAMKELQESYTVTTLFDMIKDSAYDDKAMNPETRKLIDNTKVSLELEQHVYESGDHVFTIRYKPGFEFNGRGRTFREIMNMYKSRRTNEFDLKESKLEFKYKEDIPINHLINCIKP